MIVFYDEAFRYDTNTGRILAPASGWNAQDIYIHLGKLFNSAVCSRGAAQFVLGWKCAVRVRPLFLRRTALSRQREKLFSTIASFLHRRGLGTGRAHGSKHGSHYADYSKASQQFEKNVSAVQKLIAAAGLTYGFKVPRAEKTTRTSSRSRGVKSGFEAQPENVHISDEVRVFA
ncbi:unnamed protein product [Cylicostephanus goldi]|uniref:Uncharacterized protein n=1 Tax=Cylicostephanus goldi TaxID=71465 RepID=A0A3P6Q4N0_CYLGO|nr:unnamed protein product [Cylicostephanus goldi]